VAEITIGYFLEDVGQERFLVALVERVAKEKGLPPDRLHRDVRNATGGQGKALSELRRFLRDVNREQERLFDLLVVAIDGNCHSYTKRRKEIRAVVKRSGYPGSVVCAVPDPHIEHWYLIDPRGFQQALGADVIPDVPPNKCERGHYKQALRQAVRQAGIDAPLGGLEYGPDIARLLDLYAAGKADTGFKHFVDELRAALDQLVQ
jgi:hypothetical protein